jgi:hypothetical protein
LATATHNLFFDENSRNRPFYKIMAYISRFFKSGIKKERYLPPPPGMSRMPLERKASMAAAAPGDDPDTLSPASFENLSGDHGRGGGDGKTGVNV